MGNIKKTLHRCESKSPDHSPLAIVSVDTSRGVPLGRIMTLALTVTVDNTQILYWGLQSL
jgi:hypothetical protein